MQCHPAIARLIENLEVVNITIKQLRQCEQANQQATQQKEANEAINTQMAHRVSEMARSCLQELCQAVGQMPQLTLYPGVIRMHANLERMQACCRHIEQQQATNHQTTCQKRQQEVSCAQKSQRAQQIAQGCQQDINQFVPAQQTRIVPVPPQIQPPGIAPPAPYLQAPQQQAYAAAAAAAAAAQQGFAPAP
jgi:hypothetical protein